jgi:hypothetical protein
MTRANRTLSAPTPRAYHTASLVGSQLYVLGGSNVNLEQDNLFVLDLGACYKCSKCTSNNDVSQTN